MTSEKDEARAFLLAFLSPLDTVYTILDSVSRSGMTRKIRLIMIKEGRPINITYHVATLMGYKVKDGSLITSGCGMDMGYYLVHSLGASLWPDGDGKTITGRNGDTAPETQGGYLLNQSWL